MKDHYDFKNGRKNPYAERMKNGYTVIIDREPDEGEKLDTKLSDSKQHQENTANQ